MWATSAGPSGAAEGGPPATSPEPARHPVELPPGASSDFWRPPTHDPSKHAKDWLQLKSGELLRGRIEFIRDEEVRFDSDELEDLEIDWDDIASLRSPRRNTYRFGERTVVTGTAGMQAGVIRVDTGTGVREFPRNDLYSMIEGELREINYWSLDASLGLTARSGNSEQADLSARAEIERETPLTRGLVSYESSYSEAEGVEITDNQRVRGRFDYYVTPRTFLIVPFAELYRDRIRNVDLRATVGGGAGYDVVERKRVEWTVIAGAAYQRTDFDEVLASDATRADDAALLFGMQLELDPLPDVDWDSSYLVLPVFTDWNKTSHHLSSVLSFELWGPLDLDVSFVWDRIEDPAAESDGEVPESDDFRLTVGIAIEL